MARRKAEIDLLGVASKEDLVKFEVGKEADKELSKIVSEINDKITEKKLTPEEELLLIKKRGEQEIQDIQNELKEFKISEERKISFLPIEDEEEEAPVRVETKGEKFFRIVLAPFKKLINFVMELSPYEKVSLVKSTLLILLVTVFMILAFYSVKKYTIVSSNYINLTLKDTGGGQVATLNDDLMFGKHAFTLKMISIDGRNTVLKFSEDVILGDAYNAYILDNYGKKYEIDEHYMRNVKATNKDKVLAFYPLNDGIKKFELRVVNNRTAETYSYYFNFNKFLKKSDFLTLYNTNFVTYRGVNIDSFIASSTGSSINYSFNSEGLPYEYIQLNRPGLKTSVTKNLSILPSKQNKVTAYEFPDKDITLIEEIYVSPEDFETTLRFESDNIFKSYKINKDLSYGTAQKGTKIDVGDYVLEIEGMQKQGDQAVLVMRTEEKNFVPKETVTETATKAPVTKYTQDEDIDTNFKMNIEKLNTTPSVYSLIDVEIVTFDGLGNEMDIILPERINAGDEGTDIVFKSDKLGLVAQNFKFRVKNLNIRDEKYVAYIDLSRYEHNTIVDDFEKAISDIKEGFESRLEYKAAIVPRSEIINFSDKVLYDKELMNNYVPRNLLQPATYSANVIIRSFRGNLVYAIVEEDFVAVTEKGVAHSNIDHRVIFDIEKDEIIYDEIATINRHK